MDDVELSLVTSPVQSVLTAMTWTVSPMRVHLDNL